MIHFMKKRPKKYNFFQMKIANNLYLLKNFNNKFLSKRMSSNLKSNNLWKIILSKENKLVKKNIIFLINLNIFIY